MTAYVALLRAVNVGGTGKLPMSILLAFCNEAGFTGTKTYIASGNAVFRSPLTHAQVRDVLDARLTAYAGRTVGVLIRSAEEMADVVRHNPFGDEAGNRVMALFSDAVLPADPLAGVTGRREERLALGPGVIYVFYPNGMADTRLRIPAAGAGTARNMNTVAKLAEMAAGV